MLEGVPAFCVAISYAEGGNTRLAVSRSTASNNDVGSKNVSGTLESLGNNTVRQNGTNTVGTISSFPGS